MNKKSNIPNFDITQRDVELLKALNSYRYLQTGQIQRLLFPENKSTQSTRRRLRHLYRHKYVNRVKPYVQIGKHNGESAFFLGAKGIKLLVDNGINVRIWKKSATVKHLFLQHAIALSEFRLLLEQSLNTLPSFSMEEFIADFETKPRTDSAMGARRYKLYSSHFHNVYKKSYVVYPDALIHLKANINQKEYDSLYFLEIDRGTESLARIRDKLIGYSLYLDQEIYKKFGEFNGFKILFQAHSEKRAASIRNALLDQKCADMVLVTSDPKVTRESILTGKIWTTVVGDFRSLIKI